MKEKILYLANVTVSDDDAATNFVTKSFYDEHKMKKEWNCKKVKVLEE